MFNRLTKGQRTFPVAWNAMNSRFIIPDYRLVDNKPCGIQKKHVVIEKGFLELLFGTNLHIELNKVMAALANGTV